MSYIEMEGVVYERIPLQTHVLTARDDLGQAVLRYALPRLREGDVLFISEKAAACTQNRAIPLTAIAPRPLAKLLARFVRKTPFGIGLGIPETMEMALRECGVWRILWAAFVGAGGKLFGRRGWFYRVAGSRAAGIDGPCACTLPPYNRCVVLTPHNPDGIAREIAKLTQTAVAIVDINDLGGNILGSFPRSADKRLWLGILRDNPLGQGCAQTPMGIIRRVSASEPASQTGDL